MPESNPLSDFVAASRADQKSPLRDALEYVEATLAALQTAPVTLKQIPVADLQRQLSVSWNPEFSAEDTDDSIMGSLIGGQVAINGGIANAVFGGNPESAEATQAHGLGAVPIYVSVPPIVAAGTRMIGFVNAVGGEEFTFVMHTLDDTPVSGTIPVRWMAIG